MFRSKHLKKFKEINHFFFSKNGGFSRGIYKSLNCGKGSKDNPKHVKKNINLISKKIKVSKNKLLLMHQTHSNKVKIINNKNKYMKKIKSDAIITNIRGLGLAVVTADCVPVLLYEAKNQVIGCIHAGWRGAFFGIIENTVKKIKKLNSKNNIYACIGPCIGKKSYEVDLKFYKKFISKSEENKIYFVKKNKDKKLFDLRKYVDDKLKRLNIKTDHVNYDTFREKKLFFSFRRSQLLKQQDYGRCISVISLTK